MPKLFDVSGNSIWGPAAKAESIAQSIEQNAKYRLRSIGFAVLALCAVFIVIVIGVIGVGVQGSRFQGVRGQERWE